MGRSLLASRFSRRLTILHNGVCRTLKTDLERDGLKINKRDGRDNSSGQTSHRSRRTEDIAERIYIRISHCSGTTAAGMYWRRHLLEYCAICWWGMRLETLQKNRRVCNPTCCGSYRSCAAHGPWPCQSVLWSISWRVFGACGYHGSWRLDTAVGYRDCREPGNNRGAKIALGSGRISLTSAGGTAVYAIYATPRTLGLLQFHSIAVGG